MKTELHIGTLFILYSFHFIVLKLYSSFCSLHVYPSQILLVCSPEPPNAFTKNIINTIDPVRQDPERLV
jgi:hypothetical protein